MSVLEGSLYSTQRELDMSEQVRNGATEEREKDLYIYVYVTSKLVRYRCGEVQSPET